MKKISFLLITLNQTLFAHGPHGHGGEAQHGHSNVTGLLEHYAGDFTDTDGDGMTDVYEVKYGYDPHNSESFPDVNFISTAKPVEGISVDSYEFMDLVIVGGNTGISLEWTDVDISSEYSQYALELVNGEHSLYYGGHDWDSAEILENEF